MLNEFSIKVENVSKIYKLYNKPIDRLYEATSIIKKSYHTDFFALRNVSFDVKKGESVGIVGRNGSGKSTILKIITGILSPSSGTITKIGKVSALLELGAGFNSDYTGMQNIYLNAAMLGYSNDEIEEKIPSIIAFADIGNYINQPVKLYSSGMFVRLAFALAISVEPDILIIDEALAVGDDLFQKKCYSKIKSLKSNGKTILFVSHSSSLVIEMCDRVILLDDGDKLLEGNSNTVVNLYQKLLFAPADKKEQVRKSIMKHKEFEISRNNQINNISDDSKVINDLPNTDIPQNALDKDDIEEYFDPSLIPKEPILYANDSAKIFDYKLYGYNGESINVLKSGKKYTLSYKVVFNKNCLNVRFGMLIKTKTGFDLSGAATAEPGQGIPFVRLGTILTVEFNFTPKLSAGLYFLRCGVVGIEEDTEVFLDRQIDAFAFRMLKDTKTISNSLIDFDFATNIFEE